MKKKDLLALFGTVLLSSTIMSCGGTTNNAYPSDYTIDTKGATITFWNPFGAAIEASLAELVDQFEQEYGITVNMESKGSYDNLRKAIVGAATSKKYPNVALAYPDHMAEYVNSDIILRLDSFFEHDNETTNSLKENVSLSINDFYKDYMTENQLVEFKEDGTGYTLGVPFNKSTEVMVYNKTFFDWASSIDSDIKVPSTWDELETVGKKILVVMENAYGKVIGKDNKIYEKEEDTPDKKCILNFKDLKKNTNINDDTLNEYRFVPFSYDSQANFFITLCRQWGGEYTTVSQDRKGHIVFDSDKVKEALTYIQRLYKEGIIGIPSVYGEAKYNSNPFKKIQTVMNIGSTAGADNALPAGDKFTSACAPTLYKEVDKKFVISQGTNLVMLDKGTDKERLASWQLIKYLSKNVNADFSLSTGYFPSCEYAQNSPVYQDFINKNPNKLLPDAVQMQQIAKINTNEYMKEGTNWTKFVDTPFVGSARCREEVSTIIPQLFKGNMSPTDVINKVYATLNDFAN